MQLGKIVSIACLTYVIYGISSVFQLGTFLPPIPLKPFIYIFFVVLGLIVSIRSTTSLISYALLGWITLYAFNSHTFLETFLNTESMLYYENYISTAVSLLMIIVFLLHCVFLLFGGVQQNRRYGILYLPLFAGVVSFFLESTSVSFGMLVIGWGTIVFYLDHKLKESLPDLFILTPILYAMAVIEAVEVITLMI